MSALKNNQKKSGGVGGARPGAGRPKGKVNKATAEIAEAAREMGGDMLAVLKSIAQDEDASVAARVSAASAVLDRGYGKPKQALDLAVPNDDDNTLAAYLKAVEDSRAVF